ncbi:hypothetical protein KFE25_000990 [Diacronema lutheri]|uniref:Uncharacterized protein n=1 Tax=Diacronema lutheri TaxID=2081491 RepID=A0A8J5XF97_DIALT|nr:hypothetical protein KFE25_000990 [Diacronema lutheri]
MPCDDNIGSPERCSRGDSAASLVGGRKTGARSPRAGDGRARVSPPLIAPYKGWRAEAWLFLSSFGIAFAMLSWLELAQLDVLHPLLTTKLRGLLALLVGTPFYFVVGREM